jgi:peptidoglycan/LPS O-acetylase OafA/YrhL
VLFSFGDIRSHLPRKLDRWVDVLSRTSYALFLVHFSVLLLANAAWSVLELEDTDLALLFIGASWAVSLALSYGFHTQVEMRFEQWRRGAKDGALPVAAK